MSYAAVGATLDLGIPPLPACAPVDVINDAKAACAVRSSVRGYGAVASMVFLPESHPYSDNPNWAQHPACEVAALPACPTFTALTYQQPVQTTVMSYQPVQATVATYVQPVAPRLVAAPPVAPRAPTLTAAPPKKVTVTPSKVFQVSPGMFMHLPPTVQEAGMSGAAKAGILALVALVGYGVYRYTKK